MLLCLRQRLRSPGRLWWIEWQTRFLLVLPVTGALNRWKHQVFLKHKTMFFTEKLVLPVTATQKQLEAPGFLKAKSLFFFFKIVKRRSLKKNTKARRYGFLLFGGPSLFYFEEKPGCCSCSHTAIAGSTRFFTRFFFLLLRAARCRRKKNLVDTSSSATTARPRLPPFEKISFT